MPYVIQEKRPKLDIVVRAMADVGVVADGDLNYILYAYFIRNLNTSYNNLKNYMGELNECAEELRRRLLVPHEDKKIIENGDVI